jgi:ADP-ribose pyrophosphatase YjhB (NUDIX family)/predicted transcriptional regulator
MKDLNSSVQKQILNKLMFSENLKYSDLEKVIDNHDLFNYHLKELIAKGYIEKTDSVYSLTAGGRQYVSHMEEDGELQKQFKVGMFINVVRRNDKGNHELLLYKRLKHPHYGYTGSVSGKLKWGESLEDNLKRELDEELKIIPFEFELIGVERALFENENNEIAGDGVFFMIVVTKWQGEPAKTSNEGEYFWCEIDEILNLEKIFRSGFERGLPYLKSYLEDRDSFTQFIYENNSGKLKY